MPKVRGERNQSGTSGNPVTLEAVEATDTAATSAAGYSSSYIGQVVQTHTTGTDCIYINSMSGYIVIDGLHGTTGSLTLLVEPLAPALRLMVAHLRTSRSAICGLMARELSLRQVICVGLTSHRLREACLF
jgi:hypothetical protein